MKKNIKKTFTSFVWVPSVYYSPSDFISLTLTVWTSHITSSKFWKFIKTCLDYFRKRRFPVRFSSSPLQVSGAVTRLTVYRAALHLDSAGVADFLTLPRVADKRLGPIFILSGWWSWARTIQMARRHLSKIKRILDPNIDVDFITNLSARQVRIVKVKPCRQDRDNGQS